MQAAYPGAHPSQPQYPARRPVRQSRPAADPVRGGRLSPHHLFHGSPGRDADLAHHPSRGSYALSGVARQRSAEHTSELQSLMRTSYAVFCSKNHKSPPRVTSSTTSSSHTAITDSAFRPPQSDDQTKDHQYHISNLYAI